MRETQPVDLNEREKELLETAHSLLPISAARLPAPSRARFLHRSFYRGRLIRPEQTRNCVASDEGEKFPGCQEHALSLLIGNVAEHWGPH